MRSVSVSEAKARFSELLRVAERGETVLIVRHGRAVARLTPPRAWPDGVAESPVAAIDLAALERDGIVESPSRPPDGALLDAPELALPPRPALARPALARSEGLLGRMLADVHDDRADAGEP